MYQKSFNYAPLLVLAASILWGTTGTSQAFAPANTSSLSIGAVRLAIGGLGLMIFALYRGAFKTEGKWPIRNILLASICMALYQPFFFAGVSQTGVAVGTVVTIGSSPIIAGFLEFIFMKERPDNRWFIATFMSILGCYFLLAWGDKVNINYLGIFYSLCAGFAYAAYTLICKKIIANKPPEAVTAVVFTVGALILSPLLFTQDLTWLCSTRGTIVALHLGLVATALAYGLFVKALAKLTVANAVTLTLAEPLTAGLLGFTILKETLTLFSVIGLFMIFSGLLILTLKKTG